MTNTKWIYVTIYVFFVQQKLLRSLGKAYIKVISQPRVFLPILIWYDSNHVNGCPGVEHGINHLITGQ
jgi:hypothetical protein